MRNTRAARRAGRVSLVIFDLAGTTVDYGSCAPAAAFVELFRRHGITLRDDQARGPMGKDKKEHIRRLTDLAAVKKQWLRLHGRPCSAADVDALYHEFVPIQKVVLPRYSKLIPGTIESVRRLRAMDIRIAVTTGYPGEILRLVLRAAKRQGFEPDAAVCVNDVPAGRPAPWMALTCAMRLGVYPPAAAVKIGDTIVDIEEGLNAGMWSVGVTRTGNMLGLSYDDDKALPPASRGRRLAKARAAMTLAGAHYVVDGVADCAAVVRDINARLARGDRP